MNTAATMRAMLAQQGIFLDDRPAPAPAAQRSIEAPIDRDAIRAVLVEQGVQERDLEWLAASCPSMEHALAFEPTPNMLELR
jgi:hypothetical protein